MPKVLIFHTLEWANAARMALAFQEAGWAVSALCRRGHQLRAIRALDQVYTYKSFARLRSVLLTLIDCDPYLIIPCDDRAVILLHRIHSRADPATDAGSRIRSLIERSFGRPESYGIVSTRSSLAAVAALANARMPYTEVIPDLKSLRLWFARRRGVAVVKTDHSWGGWGVRIARTAEQADTAFRSMTGARRMAFAVKRLVWDQDPELAFQLMRGRWPIITAQDFIPGTPANCSVACMAGEVLAGVAVKAVITDGPTGSATVVRVIDNPEMMQMTGAIVRHLGISGIVGFDFILQEGSEQAFLLELNPRATQISHLALGGTHDLVAALCTVLPEGPPLRSAAAAPPITAGQLIAFFPQELRRDPAGRFLTDVYHDVPWQEPALVQAFLAKDGPIRRLIAWARSIRTPILLAQRKAQAELRAPDVGP